MNKKKDIQTRIENRPKQVNFDEEKFTSTFGLPLSKHMLVLGDKRQIVARIYVTGCDSFEIQYSLCDSTGKYVLPLGRTSGLKLADYTHVGVILKAEDAMCKLRDNIDIIDKYNDAFLEHIESKLIRYSI